MMIKNIVFDMGNVLIRFDPVKFISDLGVSPEDGKILLYKVFRTTEWGRLDRGSLDQDGLIELVKPRIPERLHKYLKTLVHDWNDPIHPVEGMAELIKELKERGYKIYLLSNASTAQPKYWPRVPGSEYFDGTVISAYVHSVKPEKEIYLHLFEKFGIKPEESVFIDDSAYNCEGAYRCGMDAIVFHGEAQELREELKARGVEVSL